ncbi:MAG TPA: NADP-specific glutamate dehydrogenase [Bacteroidales bacterium]|nr:NADP-specific glutamate dehydrogenase [Bacteroidales bacterium]HCI56189.1 NADP-specific glutamate dehydrogenase [Bacteroidales bacterium]HOU96931.1 NADP-specific glutamate dehydrogenase [Bacteroidales bacterium]HQG36770.1 NADP-specific glutamate dehydrogenase [Bacteroidales bacterium]HQG53778.1 NADP-specific glutamate dehydrogenase [Bacteroidales bacterium]
MDINKIMTNLEKKHSTEVEYLQAVKEVLKSIVDVYNENPQFESAKIIERIVEPDRVIIFKVPWIDDKGEIQINLGYRVQFNNALGPYKGGLRFHPSVNLSIMKFLGFEQIFKNSLTTLALGGAKGGSDFDPKGKSNAEVMRFCQSFMLELWRYIGPEIDVPAGDIGVGTREIGFLYGMYKRIKSEHSGVLTGKDINWGGSHIRPEATGFGCVYFASEMLATRGQSFAGKKVAISGFGNVAWGAALKATELGAKVVTISGPDGYIYDPDGISGKKIEYMLQLRASNNDIVSPFATEFKSAEFHPGKRPWEVPVDIALPCAIQNELDVHDAENLIRNGCICVCEGANMPCTYEAVEILQKNGLLFAPGKAANAGGVATSGLEMSQNAMKLSWSRNEVDNRLHEIMRNIHSQCAKYGKRPDGYVDYVKGANVAGFLRVANAMLDMGII